MNSKILKKVFTALAIAATASFLAACDSEKKDPPEPTKPEPTKPEPTKPEPTKPEPTKPEPTKPEPTKPEPTKPEPAKPESTKPEPTKPEPAKPEPTKPASESASVKVDPGSLAIFTVLSAPPAPEDPALDEAKTKLGMLLYHDKRLSKDNSLSCNSCHDLGNFGVDGKQFSEGIDGQFGDRNAPTVFNAAIHVAQFWDGRAKDVEEQATGPMLNPVEMGMPDGAFIIERLKGIDGYAAPFAAAFPGEEDPITMKNIGDAIGHFERKLLTPSRFDKFLGGDETALTDAEKAGLNTFIQTGCITCHNGQGIGGHIYNKLGLVKPWPGLDPEDIGRAKVTENDAEKHFFKVPSLRNIAGTGPYGHKGDITELDEMVDKMAEHQLGRELTDEQVASIVTFLKSLTGEAPAELVAVPELP